MNDVTVFVQTCPARRHLLHETASWVERSDIGKNYTVLEHQEGQPLKDFLWSVLTEMAHAPTQYVLRLEDDAIVGRHILHNTFLWQALKEEDFGAG